MEKLRPFLQAVYRNRFWVTCVLVALTSIATWYFAWSKIEKERDDWTTKLNSKNQSIDLVLGSEVETGIENKTVRVHPNDGTRKAMDEQIQSAAQGALAAWAERYENQKKLLEFAPELPDHVRKPLMEHEPMEKPIAAELLKAQARETFALAIPHRMPALAGKIQSTWRFDSNGVEISDAAQASLKGRASVMASDVPKDLVRWEMDDQQRWNSLTTEFLAFDGNVDENNRPTSQQMLALQQDLWILGGIFDAIATVNQGFTANDLAPVERIDHILVGKMAINPELGELVEFSYRVPTTDTAATAKGKKKKAREGSSGLDVGKKRKRRSDRSGAKKVKRSVEFNASASDSPFHGRYVNRDFTQLSVSEIETAISSGELTDQSYLAVAKRVPVRIAVKMDERRINEFLAAAANSPFAFEIRQVRINKHNGSDVLERKTTGRAQKKGGQKKTDRGLSMGGGGGEGPTGADGPPQGGSRGKGGGGDEDFQSELRSNFDIDIEFIGIVKIYNPVNEKLFQPGDNQGVPAGPGTN